jgi:hypothetical protein
MVRQVAGAVAVGNIIGLWASGLRNSVTKSRPEGRLALRRHLEMSWGRFGGSFLSSLCCPAQSKSHEREEQEKRIEPPQALACHHSSYCGQPRPKPW